MFFVWDQLVTWLMAQITEIFSKVNIEFFKFFNMNLNTFFTFIPIEVLFRVFQGVGIGIAVILAMTTIMSNLMVVITDSHEDSLKVLGRVGLAVIAVMFASQIFNLVHGIFKLPFGWVDEKIKQVNSYYFSSSETSSVTNLHGWAAETNNISGDQWKKLAEHITSNDNSIAMKIICLIILFVLFKDFFKLLLSAAERYVVICLCSVCSPLAFSTLSTKRTSSIALSFIKLIICQYILMMFNIVFIKGSTLALAVYTKSLYMAGKQGLGDQITPFVFFILLCAFLKVGQKMDQYLRTLGLDVHTMGPALGNELLSTGLGAMFMVGSIARGVAHGGLRRFGKGGAGAMVPGGGGKPKNNGPSGVIDDLKRGMANVAGKKSHPKVVADNFARKANDMRVNPGALQSYAGQVLANAGNSKLAAMGSQLQDGIGIVRQGKNGAVSITDANGKMSTLLPNTLTNEDVKKYGAIPFYDASGENLMGYTAHSDTGFGMPALEQGQSMPLGEFASQDVAESIASTLGCDVNDVNVVGAGDNMYSLEDNANNYLGSMGMGNNENELVPAEFSGAAIDETGNTFAIDTAADISDIHMSPGDVEGDYISFNGGYTTKDALLEDLQGHNFSEVGKESDIVACGDNGNGTMYYVTDSGRMVDNFVPPENSLVEELPENATVYNGVESLFESSTAYKEACDVTHHNITSATSTNEGTLQFEGWDRDAKVYNSFNKSDVSITGNKENMIYLKGGRLS